VRPWACLGLEQLLCPGAGYTRGTQREQQPMGACTFCGFGSRHTVPVTRFRRMHSLRIRIVSHVTPRRRMHPGQAPVPCSCPPQPGGMPPAARSGRTVRPCCWLPWPSRTQHTAAAPRTARGRAARTRYSATRSAGPHWMLSSYRQKFQPTWWSRWVGCTSTSVAMKLRPVHARSKPHVGECAAPWTGFKGRACLPWSW